MVTTTANNRATLPRMALRQSIARYAAGEFSRRDIEKVLASTLDHNPGAGEMIRDYLDQQLHDRAISKSIYKDLLEQLGSHLPEDAPTESAEESVEDSGENLGADPSQAASVGEASTVAAPPEQKPVPRAATRGAKSSKAPDVKPQVAVAAAKETASVQLGPGTILRERFRLDEAVASGSMGLVFRATDLLKLEAGAISPVIAIKVINPEFANDAAALRSFQNEIANTQHLSHPNIIRLFELDKDQGHCFITMEWLEGESLDALLDRSRGSALPPLQAYAIIEQLCDALDYAHGKQVVHADVKPGNVFLTKPGELKLIDFGIARIHSPRDKAGAHSEKSVALTPAYASCECLEHQTATAQDDLFSLACLVYRLVSGRRVFGARTALQAEAEGIEPVAIGGMSAKRWQALRKALAFRRADRQPDVRTFAEEFGHRSESRTKLTPEPDDTKYTDTTNLEFEIEDFEEELNDTSYLGALKGSHDSKESMDDDKYLDDLKVRINQQNKLQAGTARRPDKAAAPVEWDRKVPKPDDYREASDLPDPDRSIVAAEAGKAAVIVNKDVNVRSEPKSLLDGESPAPAKVDSTIVNTVQIEPIATGTFEIKLLPEPVPAEIDSATKFDYLAINREQVANSAPSTTKGASTGSAKAPSESTPAPAINTAVKPAAPKATTKARSPVVQKLAAPLKTAAPQASTTPFMDRFITKPRVLAVGACVLLALGAALFGGLPDSANKETVSTKPLSADGIAVAVPPAEALSDRASAVAPPVLVQSDQMSMIPGDPGVVENVVNPSTTSADETGVSSLSAPADLAAQAAAASVPLGRLGDATTAVTGTGSSDIDASAADSESVAANDFNPNGPVPFSALQLEHYVEPEFPAAYAKQSIEGWVDVKVAIATDGRIETVEFIDTDLPPDFLPPSRAAVSQWRFRPFVWNSIAIAVSTTVRLTYSN